MSEREEDRTPASDVLEQMAEGRSKGLIHEYFAYLRHSGQWWLLPLFLMLALIGVLIIVGGTAAAPFIYTLF